MPREANIPLFLWVATAILLHLGTGGGAHQAAVAVQEELDVRRFAASVRRHVHLATSPVQVELLSDNEIPRTAEQRQEAQSDEFGEEPDQIPERVKKDNERVEDKEREKDEKELTQKELTTQKEKEKKEKEKEELKKNEKKAEAPVVAADKLEIPKRVAVKQFVRDKNQRPNPDAQFIGDEANHASEETQARITALDQNNPAPQLGSSYAGPPEDPGNAHLTDIGHATDSPGDDRSAPSEDRPGGESAKSREKLAALTPGGAAAARSSPAQREPGQAGQRQEQGTKAEEAAAEIVDSPASSDMVPSPRDARAARAGKRARTKRLPSLYGSESTLFGLGGSAQSPGGAFLNLTHNEAFAAIGNDQLDREIQADGRRRLSKHRGHWQNVGLERWRPAIENYVASVKIGNQTALNTARVPFANYLHGIHSRLHPIFADDFLAFLDGLPRGHPMNRAGMRTDLEIVLRGEDGRLVKMGVTHSSGSTAFDIGSLEAVQLASPFGPPPGVIISPDGNVYLHWEFHRDRIYACSTYFARPFILKPQTDSAPTPAIPQPDEKEEPNEPAPRGERPSRGDRSSGSRSPAGGEFEPRSQTPGL